MFAMIICHSNQIRKVLAMRRTILLSTILTIALALPALGQSIYGDSTKSLMQHHDMSGMMGTPTIDSTVQGLHLKVWVMKQEQHKEMMQVGAEDTMRQMGINTTTKDSMMAGTHHIRIELTDNATGKEIANASTRILVVSPSKKTSSVDLKSMMNHFGGVLTLDEKGEYKFTVNVSVNGVSTSEQFQYAVK